jgi:hypothetical protein
MAVDGLSVIANEVSADNAYRAQVMVRREAARGEIEAVTLMFRTRHATAAAALEHANKVAEMIRTHPARYHSLFDQDFGERP